MRPVDIRSWVQAIHNEAKDAPSKSEVCDALDEYAELLEDMQELTRILHKWGP